MEKIFVTAPSDDLGFLPFKLILSGITYPDPAYSIYRKCSDLYVIEYVVEGAGTIICDGQSYHIKKGDAYILPAGSQHRYYSEKNNPWLKKWINFSGTLCKELINVYLPSGKIHFPNTFMEDLFDEFFDYCTQNRTVDSINKFGAIVFHRMLQRLSENSDKTPLNQAEKVKSYIDSNIYDKLNAQQVAQKFGFSVSQLGRLFKRQYGVTVYSYILDRKLDTAKRLIKNSSVTIGEIANILNFADEHYFCNIFNKKFGMTPNRYRKEN